MLVIDNPESASHDTLIMPYSIFSSSTTIRQFHALTYAASNTNYGYVDIRGTNSSWYVAAKYGGYSELTINITAYYR